MGKVTTALEVIAPLFLSPSKEVSFQLDAAIESFFPAGSALATFGSGSVSVKFFILSTYLDETRGDEVPFAFSSTKEQTPVSFNS